MKKIITILVALVIALSLVLPAYAEEGRVIYDGNSQEFIFEPGSDFSPTDLFPNFKDVMPGDTLTQKITVKNDADKKVKTKIYIRSLGAHEDSVEFLSQLGLSVRKSKDNKMAYMFDAAADETAQLTEWLCLGTLYSGGEVNLEVELTVPVEMDNKFKSKIGYIDWEFMVEEFPIEESDPKPPQTGESYNVVWWAVLMLCSLIMMIILLVRRRKKSS